MARPVTLFTGQWADLSFEDICKKAKSWGYDGLELACWGDHMEVRRAATDPSYVEEKKKILEKYDLGCWSISSHLAGQCVGDRYDSRLDAFAPDDVKGKPEALREWAVDEMMAAARAAKAMGLSVVRVNEILRAIQEPVSLETPILSEEKELKDVIIDEKSVSPFKTLENSETSNRIEEVLSTLTDREEKIIRMRFGIGVGMEHTLEEVGKHFNLTRERIRQIENKALKKLRHPARSKLLKEYV